MPKRKASTSKTVKTSKVARFSDIVSKYTYGSQTPSPTPIATPVTTPKRKHLKEKHVSRKRRKSSKDLGTSIPLDPMVEHKLNKVRRFLLKPDKPSFFETTSNSVRIPERFLLGSLMRMTIDYGIGPPEEACIEIDLADVAKYCGITSVEQESDVLWIILDSSKIGKFEKKIRDKIGEVSEIRHLNLLLVEIQMMITENWLLYQQSDISRTHLGEMAGQMMFRAPTSVQRGS